MDLLNSEPVVSLSGDEFLPIEGKTFTQQVQEFFSAQGGKASSPFGIVLLDKRGIKNDLGHGIGRLKAASFAAVKDVLEKGVVINPMGQYHTNNKKNPTGMIAAPITIGGEKYVCVVEVIANRQVTRLYVHEVTLTKNLQGDVADSNAVPEDNSLVTQPQGEIAKVLRNYVNTKNNGENNTKTENRHMNKKQIRLTESDLKQIVKESVSKILSEAYGTFDSDTRTAIERINKAKNDSTLPYGMPSPKRQDRRPYNVSDEQREDISSIMRNVRELRYAIHNTLNQYKENRGKFMGSEKEFGIDNYLFTMLKYANKIENVCRMAYDKVLMNNGDQPDDEYFEKHLSASQKQNEMDKMYRNASIPNTDWHSAYGDRG